MFHAAPDRFAPLLDALDAEAGDHGATDVYFTVRPGAERRRPPLEAEGFRHVDDDAFVRLDVARGSVATDR